MCVFFEFSNIYDLTTLSIFATSDVEAQITHSTCYIYNAMHTCIKLFSESSIVRERKKEKERWFFERNRI